MNRKIAAGGASLAASLAFALTFLPGSAMADNFCPAGYVCVWPNPGAGGTRGDSLCTGGIHPLAGLKGSGRNSCANKAVWFRYNGVTTQCLNPGYYSDYFPGPVNELWIGADGSRC